MAWFRPPLLLLLLSGCGFSTEEIKNLAALPGAQEPASPQTSTTTSSTSSSSSSSTTTTTVPDPVVVSIQSVYPNHSQWSDYVEHQAGQTVFSSADVDCDYNDPDRFYRSCIHAGAMKKIVLPEDLDCDDLSLEEHLDALDWDCDDSGTTVIYRSYGLKRNRFLRDLVNETSWKPNRLRVRRSGQLIYETTLSTWWTNTVTALPDNSTSPAVNLNGAGTVYTLASSRGSNGYVINADRIAITTLGNAVLSYGGSATLNCMAGSLSTGKLTDSPLNSRCLVVGGYQKYLWIEGSFSGDAATGTDGSIGIFLYYSPFSLIRGVTARSFVTDGHWASGSGIYNEVNYATQVEKVASFSNAAYGFFDHYCEFVNYQQVVAANNTINGMDFYDGTNYQLVDVKSYNNGADGIDLGFNGLYGTAANVLTAFNGGYGIENRDAWFGAHFLGVSTLGNTQAGFYFHYGYDAVVSHLVSANNGGDGLQFPNASSGIRLQQTVLANNGGWGLSVFGGSDSSFGQNLIVGNNTSGNCSVAGASPGINSACVSSANLVSGVSLSSSFVGLVSSDTANATDTAGSATYSSLLDWIAFDSPLRLWGKSSASIMNSGNRGRCSTGTCQIWDWALDVTDMILRDRSATATAANPALSNGSACPAYLAIESDNSSAGITVAPYLVNAFEIIDDHIGNDDGLCSNNEACIPARHYGAIDTLAVTGLTQKCTLSGSYSGVQMYFSP